MDFQIAQLYNPSGLNNFIGTRAFILIINQMDLSLSVPKDLAKHRNDMVLLYSVASHRSWKVYSYFGGNLDIY